MKRLILPLFLFLALNSFGQAFIKDTLSSKFLVGFHPNVFYFDYRVDKPNMKYAKLLSAEICPYVAYNAYKNIYVGARYCHEFLESNFYYRKQFKQAGAFIRYKLPYSLNKGILVNLHPYLEFGFYKANYRIVKEVVSIFEYESLTFHEDYLFSENLSNSKITIPIGFTCQLSKHFYIDINWQYEKYINGTSDSGFMGGIGCSF